jgi:hypothetical protein
MKGLGIYTWNYFCCHNKNIHIHSKDITEELKNKIKKDIQKNIKSIEICFKHKVHLWVVYAIKKDVFKVSTSCRSAVEYRRKISEELSDTYCKKILDNRRFKRGLPATSYSKEEIEKVRKKILERRELQKLYEKGLKKCKRCSLIKKIFEYSITKVGKNNIVNPYCHICELENAAERQAYLVWNLKTPYLKRVLKGKGWEDEDINQELLLLQKEIMTVKRAIK